MWLRNCWQVAAFTTAVARAGLPAWPVIRVDTIAEDEEWYADADEDGEQ